jgi:predicted nucleic acid-binding protein
MNEAFLDTNILLRHLRADDPVLSPKATAIIQAIEEGKLRARTSDLVVFEAVYTLNRSYRVPKDKIAENLLSLLQLPGILLPKKRRYHQVFAIYVGQNIAFADAFHAVLMEELGIKQVLSFDHEFDRLPGITRLESPPAE